MEEQSPKKIKTLAPFLRTLLEVSFILFLFYSNLLMGEFTHSGLGQKNGFLWAVQDIFTMENLVIACVLGAIGYSVIEILRRRL